MTSARFEFFKQGKGGYTQLWENIAIRPERNHEAKAAAERLLEGKITYSEIERKTGVPWWFVGLCHYRESDCDFNTYLGNGQPLCQRTTIVPKGRGPFPGPGGFVNGAIDALRHEHYYGASDWSIERVLYRLESFNGFGYRTHHVNTPYLWGGSTAYVPPESKGGKFISDHHFDPNAVDKQLGTAVILKKLTEIDPSIRLDSGLPVTVPEPEDEAVQGTLWLQRALNKLGMDPPLVEDGINGRKTMTAVSWFQQRNVLSDTGRADPMVIAAIARQLGSAPAEGGALFDLVPDPPNRLPEENQTGGTATQPPGIYEALDRNDLPEAFHRLLTIVQAVQSGTMSGASAEQMRTTLDLLNALMGKEAAVEPDALGPVNNLLGGSIGRLLNGKKTAIGLLGGVLTAILSQLQTGGGFAAASGIGSQVVGLSPYLLPVFLGLAAWGVLGKVEKWVQGAPAAVKRKRA